MRNPTCSTLCGINVDDQFRLFTQGIRHRIYFAVVHASNLLRQDNRCPHQFLQLSAQLRLLAAGRGDCKKAHGGDKKDAAHERTLAFSLDIECADTVEGRRLDLQRIGPVGGRSGELGEAHQGGIHHIGIDYRPKGVGHCDRRRAHGRRERNIQGVGGVEQVGLDRCRTAALVTRIIDSFNIDLLNI